MPTDGSIYRGVVTFVDKGADIIRHVDRLTGREWEISWCSFPTRYCPEVLTMASCTSADDPIPVLLAPVIRRSEPAGADAWRVECGVDPRYCYIAGPSHADMMARTSGPAWTASPEVGLVWWLRHAAWWAEKLGCIAPAPAAPSACSAREREPLDMIADPRGEWVGCVPPDDHRDRHVGGGPDWSLRCRLDAEDLAAGRPERTWTCRA